MSKFLTSINNLFRLLTVLLIFSSCIVSNPSFQFNENTARTFNCSTEHINDLRLFLKNELNGQKNKGQTFSYFAFLSRQIILSCPDHIIQSCFDEQNIVANHHEISNFFYSANLQSSDTNFLESQGEGLNQKHSIEVYNRRMSFIPLKEESFLEKILSEQDLIDEILANLPLSSRLKVIGPIQELGIESFSLKNLKNEIYHISVLQSINILDNQLNCMLDSIQNGPSEIPNEGGGDNDDEDNGGEEPPIEENNKLDIKVITEESIGIEILNEDSKFASINFEPQEFSQFIPLKSTILVINQGKDNVKFKLNNSGFNIQGACLTKEITQFESCELEVYHNNPNILNSNLEVSAQSMITNEEIIILKANAFIIKYPDVTLTSDTTPQSIISIQHVSPNPLVTQDKTPVFYFDNKGKTSGVKKLSINDGPWILIDQNYYTSTEILALGKNNIKVQDLSINLQEWSAIQKFEFEIIECQVSGSYDVDNLCTQTTDIEFHIKQILENNFSDFQTINNIKILIKTLIQNNHLISDYLIFDPLIEFFELKLNQSIEPINDFARREAISLLGEIAALSPIQTQKSRIENILKQQFEAYQNEIIQSFVVASLIKMNVTNLEEYFNTHSSKLIPIVSTYIEKFLNRVSLNEEKLQSIYLDKTFDLYFKGQNFRVYIPSTSTGQLSLLVSVHGTGGFASDYLDHRILNNNCPEEICGSLASKYGNMDFFKNNQIAIIAPFYNWADFPRYDFIQGDRVSSRSDLILHDAIDFLARKLKLKNINLKKDNFYLFGHSKGGQFVSTYIKYHPDRITKSAVSGAGYNASLVQNQFFEAPDILRSKKAGIAFSSDSIIQTPLYLITGQNDLYRRKCELKTFACSKITQFCKIPNLQEHINCEEEVWNAPQYVNILEGELNPDGPSENNPCYYPPVNQNQEISCNISVQIPINVNHTGTHGFPFSAEFLFN